MRGFLGRAVFCHIWISNSGLIAKPLYEALKDSDVEPVIWVKECQKAFETLKQK